MSSPIRNYAVSSDAPPILQYSHSQWALYESCHRTRYYVDLAKEKEGRGATDDARSARRLKTLTAIPLEAGGALHERAVNIAQAIRANEPLPTLVQLRQRNSARLNNAWVSSRDRAAEWRRYPYQFLMLREHYYGPLPTPEHLARTRAQLERGVVTLRHLPLWGEVGACDPDDILIIDKRQSYVLPDPEGNEPVLVWAAPDLVFRVDSAGRWQVVDYKLGAVARGAALARAIEQVTSYCVLLRHGAHVLDATESCTGRIIYLGDGTELPFDIRPSDIDEAEQRIRDRARVLHNARTDAASAATGTCVQMAFNGVPESLSCAAVEQARRRSPGYAITAHAAHCTGCVFRELCERDRAGETLPPGFDDTSATTASPVPAAA